MYKEALGYTDSMLNYQNIELGKVLHQSVLSSQRDYYNDIAKKEKDKTSKLYVILIGGIIIFIIIVIIFLISHRVRIRIKNIEIERRVEDIMDLTATIEKQKNDIAKNRNDLYLLKNKLTIEDSNRMELESVIELLFKDGWKMLNILCNEYFEKGDSDKTRLSIVNGIDDEIKKLCSKKSLIDIEASVDRYMGGIVEKLRKQCTFIKPEDITFLTLIYAGLSPRAVCLFTGIKLKYYYNKKTRLIERILASQALDKYFFVEKLSK